MFSWLWWLLGRNSGESYDLYQPRERLIYKYWNGSKVIKADPMVLYRRQAAVGPELAISMKVAFSPSKDAPKEYQDMLTSIRGIFGTKSFEEGGLTDLETVNLFNHFLTWQGWLKKNMNPPQIPPEGTSGPTPPPATPSPGGSPPMPNTSGSGSTVSVPTTDSPVP